MLLEHEPTKQYNAPRYIDKAMYWQPYCSMLSNSLWIFSMQIPAQVKGYEKMFNKPINGPMNIFIMISPSIWRSDHDSLDFKQSLTTICFVHAFKLPICFYKALQFLGRIYCTISLWTLWKYSWPPLQRTGA